MKKATFSEARRVLSERPEEILRQIPVKKVQLALPVDGAGVRLRVSVKNGEKVHVPDNIHLRVNDHEVLLKTEVREDYEDMIAL